jgi:hypothetical protein
MRTGHALDDDVAHVVTVASDVDRFGALGSDHDALDGLGRRAADVRGAPVGAHLSIGGVDVHAFHN